MSIGPQSNNLLAMSGITKRFPGVVALSGVSLTLNRGEVLALMAEGLTNHAIADRLVLSEKTVELHVGKVLRELDLQVDSDANRRVLAVLAHLRASGRMQD